MEHGDRNRLFCAARSSFAILVGATVAVGGYVVFESKATSYLSTDSAACANCHVMLSAYNTWERSSHRTAAQCVDCHIPHENVVRKYAAKARDGARHAWVFTTNTYPEVIRATGSAQSTVQHNCIRCHEGLLVASPAHNALFLEDGEAERLCWSCHRTVPHGKGNSISSYHGIASAVGKALDFQN